MPQLPPVAAAAFVFCLLAVIVTTTVVVQIRSRRRMRLAQMVRATAPVPRPTASTAEQPLDATRAPLRGQSYRTVEQEGRFHAFEERPGREPAPGRPARRLAARVAYAAAVAAPPPVAIAEGAPPVEPASGPAPSPHAMSHGGLMEAAEAFDGSRVLVLAAESTETASVPPPLAEGPAAEVTPPEPVVVAEFNVPPPDPLLPGREPQITVLPPRPGAPALPALMTREVTLGDAARVLRGALPGVLTMTDGRHMRRAVAVGVATSVVAAAFAIRGRRR